MVKIERFYEEEQEARRFTVTPKGLAALKVVTALQEKLARQI